MFAGDLNAIGERSQYYIFGGQVIATSSRRLLAAEAHRSIC